MSLRVLLAEDHALVREAVRELLNSESDITVVGEAANGEDVLPLVAETQPDVLVLDIDLPHLNGIHVLKRLRAEGNPLPTLALSAYLDTHFLDQVLQAGANGFVHKGSEMTELHNGIRTVSQGQPYWCRRTAEVLQELQTRASSKGQDVRLGRRETEVLCLVAQGLRTREIAIQLGIAESTVEVHRRNILRKLDLHSAAELTRYALRTGLVRN